MSCWEDLGRVSGSEELAIFGRGSWVLVLENGGVLGVSGLVLGWFGEWKGGEGLLGFWVSLGKEMEEIWRTGRGSEGRRKLLIFQREGGGELGWLSCSL